jgi:hypothetical protein
VTSLVKEWQAGTHPNYGLMLLSYSVNGLYFRSRENVTNIPVLQVDMADAPPPPPVITAKATNGTVILNWSAVAGRSYQAQFCTNLVQTNWSNLPGPYTATNSTAAQSDSIGAYTQKFYRVILLP